MPLRPDKEVKKEFKQIASQDPDAYYATGFLKKQGFARGCCSACKTYFWSTTKRETCDDPACSGGFRFFKDNPATLKTDYVGMWKAFKEFMRKREYTPIDRYPVVARWRADTDFVQASIYDFQPYVVSGEIDPPANPLVVPQFCVRFNDIDNVGITMSHNTGFIMIGQHAFVSEKEWDQEKYFSDLFAWFHEGMGIPKEELVVHEDAWAGGGNYGPCMEFFSRGIELGNQVYMLFEQTEEGGRELPLKVLDMGMGHERITWFSQGKGTMYDAAFPTVIEKLLGRTGVTYDSDLLERYLPFGAYLNLDEVDDVHAAWKRVADSVGKNVEELRSFIEPLAALYSVAEHARSLLFVLSDGGLPSNVGGGYNLRVILRRALGFIDEYEWDVSLFEICTWHAEYLQELFPELYQNLENIEKILTHEKKKYEESKERHKRLVEKVAGKDFSVDELIELYDSHGVSPEEIARAAKKLGVSFTAPENFYSLVAERHDKRTVVTATRKDTLLELDGVAATEALYFDHYDYVTFEGVVVKVVGKQVILDRTAFYPTSGGQLHDKGTLNGVPVIDVFKQATPSGTVIVHVVEGDFSVGDTVVGKIDFERRTQLAQHHTATHVLTGSARQVLGNHVWQAGAAKTVEKSRLDLTHYDQLTPSEVQAIESLANSIVDENRPVTKGFMDRAVAEKKYGFRLYQGGAVPGKSLRVVSIEDFDTEACGGTHLDVTGDIGHIKIIKTSKIQDGVVRLEFVAGKAAEKARVLERSIVEKSMSILGGVEHQLPGRASELFSLWKKAKKKKLDAFALHSTEEYSGDVVARMAEVLKTQPEHIVKTLERFKKDIDQFLDK